ncbi:MAG: CoA-binding protein [Phycicoccus sp.]
MKGMRLRHQNDPDLVRRLLADPGTWAVVGLSGNRERAAWDVARWLQIELGKGLVPVHPRAETVHGAPGYASLADIPDQDLKVVDCFVSSELVGTVVDEAIEHRERLQLDAVWMQLGVVDVAAAERARAAGLDVVMDTCPKIEWPKVRSTGMAR